MGLIRWVNDKVEDLVVLHHNKTVAVLVLLLALFLLLLTNLIRLLINNFKVVD